MIKPKPVRKSDVQTWKKSHRLLMFWCEHGPTDWWDYAINRHWDKCKPRRLRKGRRDE